MKQGSVRQQPTQKVHKRPIQHANTSVFVHTQNQNPVDAEREEDSQRSKRDDYRHRTSEPHRHEDGHHYLRANWGRKTLLNVETEVENDSLVCSGLNENKMVYNMRVCGVNSKEIECRR